MIEIGLKISKEGVNANDSSNTPNSYLVHSDRPLLEIHSIHSFSRNFVSDDYYNYSHGLKYKPFVLAYMQRYDGINDVVDTDYHLLDWSIEGATYNHYSRAEITKERIRIYLTDTNLVGFVNLKGFIIIFKNRIE